MYKNKKILAIIPARSGSKELPDKNIRMLCNKPLMGYTIETSIMAGVFDEIIVSTDSLQYAEIAKQYGATVPSLRPEWLADDTATTSDVILYLLEEQRSLGRTYDYFMLLQPTSPLRKAGHIIESINLLIEKEANAVVSVCEEIYAHNLSIPFSEDGRLDGKFETCMDTRRQAQAVWLRLNGAIYLCNTEYYLQYKSFYKDKCYFYKMNQKDSMDIDTLEQFEFVQWLMCRN
ncbi:MAG: CMP-N-acetlyneuraminic acid synthetase [Cellulosilyticaceae bacterium]